MHGFTDVDAQPDPVEWLGVLDRVGDEPFYRGYQRRVRELLAPVAGGRYLEVGAGTGAAAASLAVEHGVEVVAVDRARTMTAAIRDRGLPTVLQADAHALPLADASVDGAWADRTLQHVTDPRRALAELARVVRPGGRLVLADPNYDAQVLDLDDQALARRVLRFRADVMLRNGALSHRVPGLLMGLGLAGVAVEPRTLVVRDPTAVDNVLGMRTWAHTAARYGALAAAEADAFVEQFDRAVAEGRFLWAVTFFLTVGTVR